MKYNKRKSYILETIESLKQIDVHDIVKKFKVSTITARRDLLQMETEGLLVRTHGGAIRKGINKQMFSYSDKASLHQMQKDYICKKAASFIEEGDVIFIDSGSTLFHLCGYLKDFSNLIIITNSLPVVAELIQFPALKINLIGGEIDSERKAAFGPAAESILDRYHTNKAFIGADGVSLKKGLTTYDEKEAAISRIVAGNSDKVYLLCDSSKVEKNSYVRYAPLSILEALITDDKLDDEIFKTYHNNGINIIK